MLILLLLVLASACGGSGGDRGSATIALAAEPAVFRPGEKVLLRPRFPAGNGRIDPDVGPVQSGGSYEVGPVLAERTYTMTVEAEGNTVTRAVRVPLEYRERISTLPAPPTARARHGAIALDDGRILVVGGSSPGSTYWSSAELLDPATLQLAPAGTMSIGRADPALARDGAGVLSFGGESNSSSFEETTRVERFDPTTSTWSIVGHTICNRTRHTATRLQSGWILLAGGAAFGGQPGERDAEIWEPGVGPRSPNGEMVRRRAAHTATLLADGRVLLAGGYDVATGEGVPEAEIFDPVTEQFAVAGTLLEARSYHAAVLLPDGRVLLIGGDVVVGGLRRSAEIFDPATGLSRSAGDMLEARTELEAIRLGDGRVLVAGGLIAETVATTGVEIWDPATQRFRAARAALPSSSVGHSLHLLRDARLLLLGGSPGSGIPVARAQLFD